MDRMTLGLALQALVERGIELCDGDAVTRLPGEDGTIYHIETASHVHGVNVHPDGRIEAPPGTAPDAGKNP